MEFIHSLKGRRGLASRLVLAGSLVLAAGFAQAQTDAGSRYANILADADSIARYNEYLQSQMSGQEAQIADLEAQLAAMDATAIDVQPLLKRMYDTLAEAIDNGVPFIDPNPNGDGSDLRSNRIEHIRGLMQQETVNPGELYRRLMEAYQIELEYGRTMAAYDGKLPDGREVEFLRMGRISLMYRTKDGQESGYWDNQAAQFVADAQYARAILNALLMAKKELAPDLITVPVPAATEVRS
ncbi:MAG: DUF3450 domain-containing protein [Gammaproteobacteria bacterium]|nr:DUF3450 domain-containing protein [Gammaproteobacteria bacterium]